MAKVRGAAAIAAASCIAGSVAGRQAGSLCVDYELGLFRREFHLIDFGRKADRVGSKIDERPPLCFNTSSSLPAEPSTP